MLPVCVCVSVRVCRCVYRWLCVRVCVCVELHDAVFVVGAVDEMLMLRGMRYHPIDIENSIVRAHRNICEWSVHRATAVSQFHATLFCMRYDHD